MTPGLFCLLSASSRSVVDKWHINLLLPLHARNSTKDRFQQSQGIYERFKGRVVHHTGSQTPAELRDWGLPANPHCTLKDPSIPGRPSALESGDEEKDLWGEWHPTKDSGLSSNPPTPVSEQSPNRVQTPLSVDPSQKLLLLCHSCFHFLKRFSAFHFWGQEEAQGAHLFLSSRFSVPSSTSYACSRAHTLHRGPPNHLGWQRRSSPEVSIIPSAAHSKMLEEEAAWNRMASSAFKSEHLAQKQTFPLKVWGLLLRGIVASF